MPMWCQNTRIILRIELGYEQRVGLLTNVSYGTDRLIQMLFLNMLTILYYLILRYVNRFFLQHSVLFAFPFLCEVVGRVDFILKAAGNLNRNVLLT